jgi:hypothetical protein
MSVLAVGLSHRSSPVALLERVALNGQTRAKAVGEMVGSDAVNEVMVVSTCNRTEIYADVAGYHSGVAAITELLAWHTGVTLGELSEHLYVHYEDRAVQHLFSVTCGLDSMVLGEGQILGQVRDALKSGQETGSVGRVLNDLGQRALRVGKRAHTETHLDHAGADMVSFGLTVAARDLAVTPSPSLSAADVTPPAGCPMSGMPAEQISASLPAAAPPRPRLANRPTGPSASPDGDPAVHAGSVVAWLVTGELDLVAVREPPGELLGLTRVETDAVRLVVGHVVAHRGHLVSVFQLHGLVAEEELVHRLAGVGHFEGHDLAGFDRDALRVERHVEGVDRDRPCGLRRVSGLTQISIGDCGTTFDLLLRRRFLSGRLVGRGVIGGRPALGFLRRWARLSSRVIGCVRLGSGAAGEQQASSERCDDGGALAHDVLLGWCDWGSERDRNPEVGGSSGPDEMLDGFLRSPCRRVERAGRSVIYVTRRQSLMLP